MEPQEGLRPNPNIRGKRAMVGNHFAFRGLRPEIRRALPAVPSSKGQSWESWSKHEAYKVKAAVVKAAALKSRNVHNGRSKAKANRQARRAKLCSRDDWDDWDSLPPGQPHADTAGAAARDVWNYRRLKIDRKSLKAAELQKGSSVALNRLAFLYCLERVLRSISRGVLFQTQRSKQTTILNTLEANFCTQRMELPKGVLPDLLDQLAGEDGEAGDIARTFLPLPEQNERPKRGLVIRRPGTIEKQNVVVAAEFVDKARALLEVGKQRGQKAPTKLPAMCNSLRSSCIVKIKVSRTDIFATLRQEEVVIVSDVKGAVGKQEQGLRTAFGASLPAGISVENQHGKLTANPTRAWAFLEKVLEEQAAVYPVAYYNRLRCIE
jgi:hypothetical protein